MEKINSHMWRKVGMGLCLFLMFGTIACDDDDDDGVTLLNNDSLFQNFSTSNLFVDWDMDNDNFFDEDEFTMSFFETWDTNDNNILEESELSQAEEDFGITGIDLNALDTNNDDGLDMNEFLAGAQMNNIFTGWFTAWDIDGDGLIEIREYTDGVFDLWDVDGDGMIMDVAFGELYNIYYFD